MSEMFLQYFKSLDEKLNSVQESMGDLKNTTTRLEGKLDKEIALIRVEDERQNELLAEHIAGVNTLKEMHNMQREEFQMAHQAHEKRISKVEAPYKWLKRGASYILGAGALAGSCYGIIRFWNELTTLIGG